MTGRSWFLAGLLAAGFVPGAASADYWRYETETGGIAFTDDAKNVPAKYRKSAVAVKEESLFTYPRLSVVEPIAPPTRAGVGADAAAVPVFPWPVPAGAAPVERRPDERISLDVSGVRIDVDPGDEEDEPIHVSRRQYTDEDGNYIDHDGVNAPTTVIRRGDKTLAYIDERE